MKTRLSKLVLAAALASSLPAAASAEGCDHDRDGRASGWATPDAYPAAQQPYLPDAYPAAQQPYLPDAYPAAQQPYLPGAYPAAQHPYAAYPAPYAPQPAPRVWRDHGWRARELRAVRAELRSLDAARARFYAEYGRRPGKVRKFERWYAARRAELVRRWSELQMVAWR